MKRLKFILFYTFYFIATSYSQVGINTDTPTATLDINGSIWIRGLETTEDSVTIRGTRASIFDQMVLVTDVDGHVYLDRSVIKTTFVRGGSSNESLSLISIGGNLFGWNKINFDQLDIDENNEYDIINAEFIAKKRGIYAVYVQYETSSLISASTVGVGVLKRKKGETISTLLAQEAFANISILSINASPPTRKVFTIVDLNEGDALFFAASGLSLSVQLKGGTNSYFTLFQIK